MPPAVTISPTMLARSRHSLAAMSAIVVAMSLGAESASRSTGASTRPLTAEPMAWSRKAAPSSCRERVVVLGRSCRVSHGSPVSSGCLSEVVSSRWGSRGSRLLTMSHMPRATSNKPVGKARKDDVLPDLRRAVGEWRERQRLTENAAHESLPSQRSGQCLGFGDWG